MGLAQLLKAHYSNKNLPLNLRQIVLPDATTAIGATVTVGGALTTGAWINVALAAAVTTDTLVVGVVVDTPPANMDIWTLDIGSCLVAGTNYANAAALETAITATTITDAQVSRTRVRFEASSDAGIIMPIMLEFPVWIPNAVGIVAQCYDVGDVGDHDAINVSVLCVQNFE